MKFSAIVLLFLSLTSCNSAQATKTPDSNANRTNASVGRAAIKNIVIVHGAFADGSGWEGVYGILTKKGYRVTIVQNPLTSLDADVTATKNALAPFSDPNNKNYGPVVLVGHSYGGAVITQAGTDPNVQALVYVAAYVPDEGESVGDLLQKDEALRKSDRSLSAPPIEIDGQKGIALLNRDQFPAAFAGDVNQNKAKFMADSQAPLGLPAVGTKLSTAAWKTKQSYYIVASQDRMIPPANERAMAARANSIVSEIDSSHAVYMRHADKVAEVIEQAASRQH